MSQQKKRVLFIVNIPSPYRVDFFNELGRYCDLTVAFEGMNASDRNSKWIAEKNKNFSAIYLNGIRVRSDAFLSLKVLNVLNREWDYVFLGGYSTPTLMLSIEHLKLRKKEFCLEVDGGIVSKEGRLKYLIKKHFVSSATTWMSTGRKTTEFLVHYGADRNQVYDYPFSSVRFRDILFRDEEDAGRYYSEREAIRIAAKEAIGKSEKKVVLAVGQIIPRKGYDILLNAAGLLASDCEIIIVGGNPTNELSELICRNELTNVTFIDFLKKDELRVYYEAADVFAHPAREDIWGLVVNEALAYGVPVVTTDRCIAGVELIQNGYNGELVPIEDANALAKAIDRILLSENKQTGFNAMITAKSYTIESMAERHVEVISR